jgi:hypothetical protein
VDIRELAWYLFVALTLVSGFFWHACKEESHGDFTMYNPLWFMEGDQFTDKGNTYRKWFVLVTGLAFLSLIFWAIA